MTDRMRQCKSFYERAFQFRMENLRDDRGTGYGHGLCLKKKELCGGSVIGSVPDTYVRGVAGSI